MKSVRGPVTIRTLDLGADKQVDGGRDEPKAAITPALGLRAIRLCLSEPSLFKPQLRAILRAAVHGEAQMMIPMLSSLQELEQSLSLVREVCAELEREGIAFNPNVPIGGMIEVPSLWSAKCCVSRFGIQEDALQAIITALRPVGDVAAGRRAVGPGVGSGTP